VRAYAAADIHLDTPLRGLAAYEDAPLDLLRSATRRAFANLVDAAIEDEAALLLLAGDVFDGDWPHFSTGLHFVSEMLRLRDAGIHVVSIAGNHDAASKITKALRLPDNVHVLSTRRTETWTSEELGVAVHGQGYAKPALFDDISLGYPAPVPGLVNIGLLHTSVDGRPGHEPYAPCSVEGLVNRGYDYFGLGHVHAREILHEDPAVVFSGTLQGRGLRESGPKGATLITFDEGSVTHEHRVLDCVRWETIAVDASSCADRDEVCASVTDALRATGENARERLLAARVVIIGSSDAHDELTADPERLRHEVTAAAVEAGGDGIWIEGVQVQTTSRQARPAAGDDAVGELVQELAQLDGDEQALAELGRVLEPLARALPVGVLENWNPLDPDRLHELLAEIGQALPLRLLQRSEG
jgi:DNA repair exonuclease SbcCD nuclease subunit